MLFSYFISPGSSPDLVVAAESDLCWCRYGSSAALCKVKSGSELAETVGADWLVPKSQCDYYKEKKHLEWNFRRKDQCSWAKKAVASRHVGQAESVCMDGGGVIDRNYLEGERSFPASFHGERRELFSERRVRRLKPLYLILENDKKGCHFF